MKASMGWLAHVFVFLLFISATFSAPFWLQTVKHNGISAFNPNPSTYAVFRNVMDYGAVGDGIHDDTAAIQAAVGAGGRCGLGCPSSTLTPALVFFPSGTYLISSPIIQYYYTQFVGDAINLPTLLAASSMNGYLIQSDPYDDHGNSWWTNQNNFYRQVRNFKIDLTRCPPSVNCVGIHWQVAQATSITNVVIEMSRAAGNQHQGIWMENGSGGFMSDLIIYGGKNAMWIGNQQFTSRNVTINSAETGIYLNWDWGWTFKTLTITNCQIGVDISAGKPSSQQVSSIMLMDVNINNTPLGIQTTTSSTSQPHASGTMIIDNARFTNVQRAVGTPSGSTILAGPANGQTLVVPSWGQGQFYNTMSGGPGTFVQGYLPAPIKSSSLLNSATGYFFERPRPQYESYSVNDVINIKSQGAYGDGIHDDTAVIAKTLQTYSGNKIIFFPQGAYLITDTVLVPAGSRIVGEVWSVIMASGNRFGDMNNPRPMWQIGNPGDQGVAELSDLLFSTVGPQPGAILIEWNIRDPVGQQGVSGMWDVHFRIGGAIGTKLQYSGCSAGSSPSAQCMGAFALLHLRSTSSAYIENLWAWTADHDLDEQGQTSIYTGRGILIESQQGPVWMYGTAAEHNVMYQYSLVNAQNVVLGMIQTETPYYQTAPKAPAPYVTNTNYHDPDFSSCSASSSTCAKAWGFNLMNSSSVYLYGAGLYSFFNNYNQQCLTTESCQDSMVAVLTDGNSKIYIYNLNTEGATNMVVSNNGPYIEQDDNRSTFCSTIVADLSHVKSN